MILILLSLIMGYAGINIGGMFGGDILVFLFGIVGVLSPTIFVLDKIYKANKLSAAIDLDVTSTLDTLMANGIITADEYEKSLCNINLVDESYENRRKYDEGVKAIFHLSQKNIILEDEFNKKIILLKNLYKQ